MNIFFPFLTPSHIQEKGSPPYYLSVLSSQFFACKVRSCTWMFPICINKEKVFFRQHPLSILFCFYFRYSDHHFISGQVDSNFSVSVIALDAGRTTTTANSSDPATRQAFLPVEHRSYNRVFKISSTILIPHPIPPPHPPPPLKLSPKTQKMSV